MRTIKNIHPARPVPMEGLLTHSPLNNPAMSPIDPFIFLNHHGPQHYKPNNRGLPFGPHPHKGMETVTFILEGDIRHRDSSGHDSVIRAGGIQWMTAGSGLIHEEISSDQFKKEGGDMEILQLWLNLPARLKTAKPFYMGLQKEELPVVEENEGKVKVQVISGIWGGKAGAVPSINNISLQTLWFSAGGHTIANAPREHSVFFYIVRGKVKVAGQEISSGNMVEFAHDGDTVTIDALTDAVVLYGYALPIKEKVVAYGPFVMNSMQEIEEAYEEYRQGKFGSA